MANTNQNINQINDMVQVAIPLIPEHIIEQLKGSESNSGEYNFLIFGNVIIVPGLTTQVYDLYPADTINVIYKHHTISSDFYDPTITFQYNIDDRFNLTPDPVPFNDSKELTISYYLPYKVKQQYIFTNPTLIDMNVTIYFEATEMSRNFYENYYKVLLKINDDMLNSLISGDR